MLQLDGIALPNYFLCPITCLMGKRWTFGLWVV